MSTQAIEAVTITLPQLNEGERYAGIQFEDGKPHHHVILLPGDNDDANHDAQLAWAKEHGGDLPSLREHMLLRANLPEDFKADYYWSNEKRRGGYAWCQYFGDGFQDYFLQYYELRARAVRRIKA